MNIQFWRSARSSAQRLRILVIVIAGFSTIVLSYQNCGQVNFNRGAGVNEKLRHDCPIEIPNCVQNDSGLVVTATNFKGIPLTPFNTTCERLSPEEISVGRQFEVKFEIEAKDQEPKGYSCFRSVPSLDSEYWDCGEKLFPPDGGELAKPPRLGHWKTTDEMHAVMWFDKVVVGTYQTVFAAVGTDGSPQSKFKTIFNVSDCATTTSTTTTTLTTTTAPTVTTTTHTTTTTATGTTTTTITSTTQTTTTTTTTTTHTTTTTTTTTTTLPPVVPQISFLSNSTATVAEGGSAVINVHLSQPTTIPTHASVIRSTGNATPVTDFSFSNADLSFAPGEQDKSITIPTLSDSVYDPDETVTLSFANLTNLTIGTPAITTFTITEVGAVPTIQFSLSTSSANEADGTKSIALVQSRPSQQAATVVVTHDGGSADRGVDYTFTNNQTITIPALTTNGTVSISIINDDLMEPNETAKFKLVPGSIATLGTKQGHTLTILDDNTDCTPPTQQVLVDQNISWGNSYQNDSGDWLTDITGSGTAVELPLVTFRYEFVTHTGTGANLCIPQHTVDKVCTTDHSCRLPTNPEPTQVTYEHTSNGTTANYSFTQTVARRDPWKCARTYLFIRRFVNNDTTKAVTCSKTLTYADHGYGDACAHPPDAASDLNNACTLVCSNPGHVCF